MPGLQGTVTKASPGLHGFDANTVISAEKAAAFRQQGFHFCVRYLSRSTPQAGGDLTREEAAAILSSGLSLMPVQHVAKEGWVPTAALGTQIGKAAAVNAQGAGFPSGVNVWLDLEGVRAGVASEDVVAYCNAWFDEVSAAGFVPGIYVGAKCVLTGDELFWRLRTSHYWRSGSTVPDVERRGYQLIQRIASAPDTVNGIEIDRDVTVTDSFGNAVIWLSP